MYFKVLFMNEQNQTTERLQEVKDIRSLMERSSRFISLSGLSGVAAGAFALAGAAIARYIIFKNYYTEYNDRGFFASNDFSSLKWQLIVLSAGVFAAAFFPLFILPGESRAARAFHYGISHHVVCFWNMTIPLAAGAIFILGMLQYDEWRFVAPCCLLFYGLALVNASKYTLTDIRYLGYCEIVLGLINMQWIGYGLYFWAVGFGLLHIVYGILMWWKYERPLSPERGT